MAKQGWHYRFRSLEFWAERGLINMLDERYQPDDKRSFLIITVRQFLLQLKAINDAITEVPGSYVDEREAMHKAVADGIKCCKEAKNQGRPDDPKAVADMLKARRRNWVLGDGRSTALHTSGTKDSTEGSCLPIILGPDGKPFFRSEEEKTSG